MIISHSTLTAKLIDRLLLRLSHNTCVDGLWVGVLLAERDTEILDRLREALELIKIHDAYRYRMVMTEVERIWVRLLPNYNGVWVDALRRCLLDPRYVLSSPPAFIASTIVHEATHGFLMRHHIGYSEELRYRVEQICMRQEFALASKLPNNSNLKSHIERKLAIPPTHWSDEALEQLRHRGDMEIARETGVPQWLMKAAVAFRDRKTKRRRGTGATS